MCPKKLVAGKKNVGAPVAELPHQVLAKRKTKDVLQRIHELEVQNEALIRSQVETQTIEEALRESEARYRSILEDQTELICRYLPDGRLSYVNEAYARYYGETAQQLINTNFIPHIPEPDVSMVIHKISEITSKEPAVVYEHRIIKPDGGICWQRWTHRGIYNAAGDLVEHQAVGNDISERKRAEEELRRYLSELKVLYDNGLAISVLREPREIGRRIIETLSSNLSWHHLAIRLRHGETDDLELIALNQPNLNGYEAAEAEKRLGTLVSKVGQGLSGWSIQIRQAIRTGNVQNHPQYVDTYSGICSGMYMPLKVGERVIGCIAVESEEQNAFTEQDERFLTTLAAQTAIAFENARLYQNLQQELQERERAEKALRESEERFRLAIQATKDGLWEWDVQTHNGFFSPRWCEIIGYSFDDPELPHTYNSWAERIHPDDYERVTRAMTGHLEKSTVYNVDYRHKHKSGEYRWQNSSGEAVFDENGKFVKMVGCISDITERKRVEEALRIAEADYRAIFERAPVGIFRSTSEEGHFVKVNQAMADIYGYDSPEEMIQTVKSIATQVYIDPSLRWKFQSLLVEEGEVQGYVVQNRRKDGSLFWSSENARVVKNEKGDILYFEGFIEDITSRRQAEEQIQLLAKFPAEDPNPVLRVAQDGTLLYINDAGLRFLPQWNLQVDREVPPILQEAVVQSMRNETTQTLDLEHGERLYAFYVAPIVSAGYANLYGHDITESSQVKALRDAETRYHALFDQSPYGVLLVDPKTGRAIEANETTSRQLGYTPGEFAVLKISDYDAIESPEQVIQHMQNIEGSGSDNFETLHRTKTGEVRNVHVWVKTLKLDNRNFFYTIYQDITERKQMEEVNEAYSREIVLLEERQRIASDLHDAVSQTLFSARLTAENLLRQFDRQSDTFTRSLIDLNRLVRSASGEIRLILVELRTNALLNVNLTTLLTNLIDSGMARTNANLIFQCHVDDPILPVKVKLAFYRIAQEAISNAIKHGKPANINCILRENQQALEMVVKDDGTGFSIDKVSDDHFGLQIMRERADLSGVKLDIAAQPGQGTSVTVSWRKD
jgi:PAS domain S-box-containing protein